MLDLAGNAFLGQTLAYYEKMVKYRQEVFYNIGPSRSLSMGRLLKGLGNLAFLFLLVLIVAAAKILTVEANASIYPASSTSQPVPNSLRPWDSLALSRLGLIRLGLDSQG